MRAQAEGAFLTGADVLGRIMVPMMGMRLVSVCVRASRPGHAAKDATARRTEAERQSALLQCLHVGHVPDRHERPRRQQNQQQEPREENCAGRA